jgi:hypothetical protein
LFTNSAIPATVAGGDEVGDTTALKKGGDVGTTMELIYISHHFHKPESNNCGLCIVTKTETVYETCRTCYDVLQYKKKMT